jgi:hypothetical protein
MPASGTAAVEAVPRREQLAGLVCGHVAYAVVRLAVAPCCRASDRPSSATVSLQGGEEAWVSRVTTAGTGRLWW